MEKGKWSFIVIGIGIVILLVSLLADPLGIGGYPGIGYKQIIGAAFGIVITIIGFVLLNRR